MRVFYNSSVIKRMGYTILGTEEEWQSLSVMDFMVVESRRVKQDSASRK